MFPVLWSGLCCYTEGWGGKCSEILATIKLLYNPRVSKVFTHLNSILPNIWRPLWGGLKEKENTKKKNTAKEFGAKQTFSY